MRYNVVLKNDDQHSFIDIIGGLSAVCQIPIIQAEQIATIAHYKGSAVIKENIAEDLAYQYMELFEKVGIPTDLVLQD